VLRPAPAPARRLAGVALTSASLAVALVLPAGQASAAPAAAAVSSRTTATYGAGWMARQITANGGHMVSFGAADPSDTAYAVLGLHATGVGASAGAQAVAYLETQLTDALKASDGNVDPGRLGYWVMAAVASGADPHHFGGQAARNDLVARLLATSRTSGPDKGLFGAADPTFDGAFRQGVALAGLKAAGVPASNAAVTRGVAWLKRQQCADGMWTSYRSDTSVPCPAADPSTFAGPDTNSTGMAAQGLAAYGLHPRAATTLSSLQAIQSADGGFPFLAAPGQASDPDSTALSIQGILALGGSPTTARWRVAGVGPYAALAAYQLGCADSVADRGAYFFPGDRSPSVLATVQSVVAAAGKTLPLPTSALGSAVPVVPCPSSAATAHGVRTEAIAATALAGTAGKCPGTTGVTVAVDLTAFGGGVKVRCAPGTPTTGIAALQQAGFTVAGTAQYGLAFVCRINNKPSPTAQACTSTPPTTAYWAYYHANAGATSWTYSTVSAATYKPLQGSIEGWAFGASAKPSKTPAQIRKGK
jgi:hypothetical protein